VNQSWKAVGEGNVERQTIFSSVHWKPNISITHIPEKKNSCNLLTRNAWQRQRRGVEPSPRWDHQMNIQTRSDRSTPEPFGTSMIEVQSVSMFSHFSHLARQKEWHTSCGPSLTFSEIVSLSWSSSGYSKSMRYLCTDLISHVIEDRHLSGCKSGERNNKKWKLTHFPQVRNRKHRIQNLSLLPMLFSYRLGNEWVAQVSGTRNTYCSQQARAKGYTSGAVDCKITESSTVNAGLHTSRMKEALHIRVDPRTSQWTPAVDGYYRWIAPHLDDYAMQRLGIGYKQHCLLK
jgi:hypothetical protein